MDAKDKASERYVHEDYEIGARNEERIKINIIASCNVQLFRIVTEYGRR